MWDYTLLGSLNVARPQSAVWRFLLILVLLYPHAFALNPDWNLYQFGHRAWRIDDGYLGSYASALTQDKDGYLWLGTSHGLFRFDGVRFTQWIPPDGTPLPSGSIHSLFVDRDGSLWIGGDDGVSHWDHHRLSRYKNQPGQVVTAFAQDESGVVWFVSYRGNAGEALCKVDNEKLTCYGKKDGVPQPASTLLARDASGTFWMGWSDSIFSWKEGLAKVYSLKQLGNKKDQIGVTAIAFDTDGSLFVGIGRPGSGMGLQRFRNGEWSAVTAPGFDGSRHGVSGLYVDRHHALWISTTDEGVYRLYQGRADHFGRLDGLSSDFTGALYEDHEGSIWVSTSEGMDQLRDLPVRKFSRAVSPKAGELDNLVTLGDGSMWVGGAGALYTLPKEGTQFIPQGKGLEEKLVTTIFGDRSHRIWVGLDDTLNLFHDGVFTPVKMQDGQPAGFTFSMAEDAAGNLFALTTGPPRSLLSIDPNSMRASVVRPALNVTKIAADPHEGIWTGTTEGEVQHFSDGKVTTHPLMPQPGKRITQLTVMPTGEVLASGDLGFAFLTGGVVHILGTANGLPCSHVHNFIFDASGNLWLYTACGLVRLGASELRRWRDNNATQLALRVFDASDGFRASLPSFEGAARSADGRLWFNNYESLLMIDPMRIHVNDIPPPVHIQAMRADFHDYAVAENITLPPLTHSIEIAYVALSFVSPDKNRSRYRLSGFDPQWHDAGTLSPAVYTNLRPGSYSFQVIASNNDGIWNETGASLNFTILPAWYQTIWFRALCVAASAFLLWMFYRLRLQQMERQYSARMEERVGERTRIARELHDTLLQSLHGLMFQFQAARNMLPRSPEGAGQTLDEAIAGTEQAIAESRDAIHDLRSQSMGEGDLAQLLEAAGEELAAAQDTKQKRPTFRVIVEGEPRRLSPVLQDEVYRIALEVLRNAFRHAGAGQIEAEIRYDNNQLRLRLRDDGKGIDPKVLGESSRPGHWGLPGVRERAQRIGSQLSFWSQAGAGTEVELTVPAAIAYQGTVPDSPRFKLLRKERKL
ncbi:MAG: two-component regulator propeller domain-containing protein [Edaphobacter sp.]